MAATESTGLTFVNEEEIPIAFLRIAHVDSENEQPSDVDSSEDKESTNESREENDSNGKEEPNYSNLRWSSDIRAPQDRNFNKEISMRVEMEENSSCLQHFELLFTNDVYQLILNQTIWLERQKRHLHRNLRGNLHDFTIPELKAWLGLTLNMGLVTKNSIKS